MIKAQLNDGNSYGCALNANRDGIILQLDDVNDGQQVRVRLDADKAGYLAATLTTLAVSLPDWPGWPVCKWTETGDGWYDTGCNNGFETTSGTVQDNKFRFCPFCGKEIKTQ